MEKDLIKKPSNKEHVFLGCIIVLAGALLLANLGNHYLWQDEAQTALIAKTVMARGLPYGTDGTNYFSQENGAEYGPNYIWKWHTWLPFYILAGVFKIFGISTFTARLPFALFGIGTFPLLYFYTADLFKNKRIAVFTTLLLISCIPFLILSRQCRYYSMTAFFSVLSLYAYHHILEKRKCSILLFIIATTLLFQTHYIYFATVFATIGIHCLLFHRNQWRHVGLACAGSIALSIPWILWLSTAKFSQRYGQHNFDFVRSVAIALVYITKAHKYIFPAYLLLVPILILLLQKLTKKHPSYQIHKTDWSAIAIPVLFICITVATLAFSWPYTYIRYLCPVIPILLMTAGFIVNMAYRIFRCAGIAVLALVITAQPAPDFIYELTHNYDGPIEGIVAFLDKNAKPDDIIAITYGDMPLKFYTDLRIVGGYAGEDLSIAKNAKWVILRKHTICSINTEVRNQLKKIVNLKNYQPIEINYSDIPFENREALEIHHFRTVTSEPNVVILEKIR